MSDTSRPTKFPIYDRDREFLGISWPSHARVIDAFGIGRKSDEILVTCRSVRDAIESRETDTEAGDLPPNEAIVAACREASALLRTAIGRAEIAARAHTRILQRRNTLANVANDEAEDTKTAAFEMLHNDPQVQRSGRRMADNHRRRIGKLLRLTEDYDMQLITLRERHLDSLRHLLGETYTILWDEQPEWNIF